MWRVYTLARRLRGAPQRRLGTTELVAFVAHAVDPNFGKNPCVILWLIIVLWIWGALHWTLVFLERLLFLFVQGLREPAQELSLSHLYSWGLISFTFTRTYILYSLRSVCIRKFLISKSGSSEYTALVCVYPEYPEIHTRKFRVNSQWILSAAFEWKFVGAPIHPPSRRHHGPFNWYQSLASPPSLTAVKKWCRHPMRYPLSHL